MNEVMDLYDELREEYYEGLEERKCLPLEAAISKKLKINFALSPPAPAPATLGVTDIRDISISMLIQFIDWNPFFQTWELRSRNYKTRGM